MPKSVKRLSFQRVVTYTYTADMPGYAVESDANALVAANLPGGTNSIGLLLAGAPASGGVISNGAWSVSTAGTRVEPYGTFTPSFAYAIGARVAPSAANAARLHVVTVAGTSAASEPTWATTVGTTNVSGGATFMAIDKFAIPAVMAISTVYTAGQVLKPSTNSVKEYLVTVGGTSAASLPTFTSFDAVGNTTTSGGVTLLCIAGVTIYATQTLYSFGQAVKSSGAQTQEWICSVAGKTDDTAGTILTGTVGATVVSGTASFLRVA